MIEINYEAGATLLSPCHGTVAPAFCLLCSKLICDLEEGYCFASSHIADTRKSLHAMIDIVRFGHVLVEMVVPVDHRI